MNKSDFLQRLRAALHTLPDEECQSAVKYYEEYFEEAGIEREQEILDELGSPEDVAKSILWDYSSVPVAPENVEHKATFEGDSYDWRGLWERIKKMPVVWIVILAVILVPVLASAFGWGFRLIFGLIAAAITILFALPIMGVGLIIGGVGCGIAAAIGMLISPASSMVVLGVALLMLGFGLLVLLCGIWMLTKAVPAIVKGITKLWKQLFGRKDVAA